ncbi:peptidylprolyl isomerase SurA [Candidatus Erwinia haradaeae]|uniref:Chaperone SurA n=1 Tax=Candidatus Erwinia haradaeae TaxID=1922217 RepID=A0A451DAW2_9GAMM|nr:peptidylprolyl isomerase SurA [Candidatus Erwinia haradaeae]VFP83366.1 Chaperone SurA [Candidatus Erwinia haradaeae]
MINWKILLFAVVLIPSMACSQEQVLDKVAAVVNNSIVLDSDVNRIMKSIQNQAQQLNQSLPDEKELRFKIIDKLVIDTLFVQKTEQLGLRVNDFQLEQVIQKIAKQHQISVDQLYKAVADQGLNYSDYREQIRHDVLLMLLRNREILRGITMFPEEVDGLAEQLKLQRRSNLELNLSSAMFPLPADLTFEKLNEQKNIANQFIQKVKEGFNFHQVKIPYFSGCRVIPTKEMGWRGVQELPFLFISDLLQSHKGSLIGPIQSSIGWHVLQVNDMRGDRQKHLVTELNARHIILKSSSDLSAQRAKEKIFWASKAIKSGTSFNHVSQLLFKDVGAAYQGGDLGWMSLYRFDPEFYVALQKLKKGQISTPVHSSLGWHIMYIIDTHIVDRTDEFYKNEAYHLLLNRKFSVALEEWIEDERAAAYIQILP